MYMLYVNTYAYEYIKIIYKVCKKKRIYIGILKKKSVSPVIVAFATLQLGGSCTVKGFYCLVVTQVVLIFSVAFLRTGNLPDHIVCMPHITQHKQF